ncbi:unnamed protein product [Rhizophagus irregularis]|nr:unnamed protein product [Rhizophagus irregularis]
MNQKLQIKNFGSYTCYDDIYLHRINYASAGIIQPNQFLRGLNKENSIKSERIGVKRDIEELVNLLERVEKERTAPGKERQDALQYHQDHYIEPIQFPQIFYEKSRYRYIQYIITELIIEYRSFIR